VDRYADPRNDNRLLAPHPLGVDDRRGDVLHMCPECGWPVQPFCPTCLGAGVVDEGRLYRWQNQHLAETR
jgi:hypothetical protein